MTTGETGQITGTADTDYNPIWFTQTCLKNTLRLETFIGDAQRGGDSELAEFFRKAQADSRMRGTCGPPPACWQQLQRRRSRWRCSAGRGACPIPRSRHG